MHPSADISIGDDLSVSTEEEGDVGSAIVKEKCGESTINMSLSIPPEKMATRAAQSLRRLAAAAEDLAFAPMNDEEMFLEQRGLLLSGSSPVKRLKLGTDFDSIYVDPTLTHLSIRLLGPRT